MPAVELHQGLVAAFISVVDEADRLRSDRVTDAVEPGDENETAGDTHPVHLHRHTFEVTKVGDKPTLGLMKDTLNIVRFTTAEIDFVADDPGLTLFHCHHQDHQDEGFMGLIHYA